MWIWCFCLLPDFSLSCWPVSVFSNPFICLFIFNLRACVGVVELVVPPVCCRAFASLRVCVFVSARLHAAIVPLCHSYWFIVVLLLHDSSRPILQFTGLDTENGKSTWRSRRRWRNVTINEINNLSVGANLSIQPLRQQCPESATRAFALEENIEGFEIPDAGHRLRSTEICRPN